MEQKFCPYCGKPLEEDQPCRCEGAKQAAREAAQQPLAPGRNLGLKILVGVLSVVLVGLMAALIFGLIWKLGGN